MQNRGRQHLEPNESLTVAGPSVPVQDRVDQHIPVAGPSAPIAGPSRSVQERVGQNSRFQQIFQARQNNQRENHSSVENQNNRISFVEIYNHWTYLFNQHFTVHHPSEFFQDLPRIMHFETFTFRQGVIIINLTMVNFCN